MSFKGSDIYFQSLNGTETVRLGVAVALIDEFSRLLLELRSDVSMWGITGGRLDPGETAEECAIREIHEETGLLLDLSQLQLFAIYADPVDGRILQYPDNRVHLVDILYVAKIPSDSDFVLSPESLELSFYSESTLPNDIVPPALKPIADLVKARYVL